MGGVAKGDMVSLAGSGGLGDNGWSVGGKNNGTQEKVSTFQNHAILIEIHELDSLGRQPN